MINYFHELSTSNLLALSCCYAPSLILHLIDHPGTVFHYPGLRNEIVLVILSFIVKIKSVSDERALVGEDLTFIIRPTFGNPSFVRHDRPNFEKPQK